MGRVYCELIASGFSLTILFPMQGGVGFRGESRTNLAGAGGSRGGGIAGSVVSFDASEE